MFVARKVLLFCTPYGTLLMSRFYYPRDREKENDKEQEQFAQREGEASDPH